MNPRSPDAGQSNVESSTMSMPGGGGEPSQPVSASKARQRLTRTQRAILEAAYERNNEPNIQEREALAVQCDRSLKSVTAWFQARHRQDKNSGADTNRSLSTPVIKLRVDSGSLTLADSISAEEEILFKPIRPILADLHQLYQENPTVSIERANNWAMILGLDRLNAPPGIIEQWLNWRRLDEEESNKRFSTPRNVPTQSPSTGPNVPYMPYSPQPSQTVGGRQGTHLPTPFSASPSPRTSTLSCKNEPPSPVFDSAFTLLSSPLSPAPLSDHNAIRSATQYPTAGSRTSTSPVGFAHPNAPVRQGSQHAASSFNHQPHRVEPQTLTLTEFMRSQFVTRADFDTAVEKMQVNDADGALKAFARMGQEAADAIAELAKVLGQVPS